MALMILMLTALSACSGENKNSSGQNETAGSGDDGKYAVVATVFPEYDWVKNVVGGSEHIDLTLLVESGADIHNYQPSAEDIMKIKAADVFIYVGGESDDWVDDTLETASNKNMKVIKLMDVLAGDIKEEEVKEGMQEADHDHDDGEADHDGEEDEHVWLSLKNAEKIIKEIERVMSEVDSDHADLFSGNADSYIGELRALDKKYEEMVSGAKRKVALFGDRFPFRYMFDDYGIDYYAAFPGCSAETEASFETISYLSDKTDELKLPCIMTIEGSDKKIAKTIIDNTKEKNQKILTMDSLQSVSKEQIDKGVTYLGEMEKDLEVLKEALG